MMMKQRIFLLILFLPLAGFAQTYYIPSPQPLLDSLWQTLEGSPSDSARMILLNDLASRLIQNQEVETLGKVLGQLEQIEDPAYYTLAQHTILHLKGAQQQAAKEYDSAIYYYDTAFSWFQENPTTDFFYHHYIGLGICFEKTNQIDRANAYYQQAHTLFHAVGQTKAASTLLWELIMLSKRNSNYYLAYKVSHQRLDYLTENQLPKASAFNSLGVYYQTSNDYPKAIHYYTEALLAAESENNARLKATALSNAANIKARVGDYNAAISYTRRALEIKRSIGDLEALGLDLSDIVGYYSTVDLVDSATYFLDSAIVVAEKIQSPSVLSQAYLHKSFLMKKWGQLDSTLHYRKLALENIIKVGHAQIISRNYYLLGEAYFLLGQAEQGILHMERGVELAKETSNWLSVISASRYLSRYYDSVGAFEKAYEYMAEYAAAKDSSNLESLDAALLEQELRYQYETQRIADSIQSLEASKVQAAQLEAALARQAVETQKAQIAMIGGGSLLVLGISGMWIAFTYRQRRQRESFERSLLDYQLKALRAQINPHFLFNAMASIQRYILNHDRKEANDYLTKFSRFMRLVLYHSDKMVLTLAEELKGLQQYLEIEQIRLGKRLNWSFEVADSVDADAVEFPSMLLQTFAENAVWHGLSPKEEGEGRLAIRVFSTDTGWALHLEDNGIGREAARNHHARPGHQSKGLQMIADKMNLFNLSRPETITYQGEDLVDKYGNALGTRVVIDVRQP